MTNRVLILTNDAADAKILIDALGSAGDGPFEVEWVRQLAQGQEHIRTGGIDAILADLSPPDSGGLATFDQLLAAAPHTPNRALLNDRTAQAVALAKRQ